MTESIRLENEALLLEFHPDAGGRWSSCIDRKTGRDWLWNNSQTKKESHPFGTGYDDVWSGGFDELFPNDLQETFDGISWPDHGELWSRPWNVRTRSSQEVELETETSLSSCRWTKSFHLSSATVQVRYHVENRGAREVRYLFKLHPSFSVAATDRLRLPGGSFTRVDPTFSTLVREDGWQAWPGKSELDRCRAPSSGEREFVYVRDLPQGWCGVEDTTTGRGARISYSLPEFPYCWIFMTYGGWRGHQVVVLEPCTSYPKSLDRAAGTLRLLKPGETATFEARLEVGNLWR